MINLIYIDDDTDCLELLRLKFRKEIRNQKIVLHFYSSAVEALTYITKNLDKNMVVLSDINMPGMSGQQLIENIRILSKTIPIYVLSGDEKSKFLVDKFDVQKIFIKPINYDELKEQIL